MPAERVRDRIAKLFKRATEELATRLELSAQAEQTEPVVRADVHAAAELLEEEIETRASIPPEAIDPLLE